MVKFTKRQIEPGTISISDAAVAAVHQPTSVVHRRQMVPVCQRHDSRSTAMRQLSEQNPGR
jgi:hypothetical protein